MASRPCWQCLSRLSIKPSSRLAIRIKPQCPDMPRLFSTTAPTYAGGKANTLRLRKKQRTKGYKAPDVGERKALRKRIVLSNSNAVAVSDLQDWSSNTESIRDLQGKVAAIPDEVIDGLRALDSFKSSQGWRFFRQPAALMRKETVILERIVHLISSNPQHPLRRIIVGSRGSGKSVLLLQAHAAALMKGWVVMHLPDGLEISSAVTAYAPIPGTEPTQYSQPDYTAKLLRRIANANRVVLAGHTVQLDHSSTLSTPLRQEMTLLKLAEAGASDPDNAWSFFKALWAELTIPESEQKGTKLPPIMLTMDGLAPVSRLSAYLAPNMHFIHSHDLAIVNHFMSCISGKTKLPNGGAVLAVDSMGTRPSSPSLDLAIKQSEQKRRGRFDGKGELPLYDTAAPFDRQDERVLLALREVPIMRIKGINRDEARAVLEYYAKSGMMRARITDTLVNEKWLLSGRGIIGELERASVAVGFL